MSDPVDLQAFLVLCEMAVDNIYGLQVFGELGE
jgi:hypothetical protein